MQLLPTIIIVALLGFFIILTLALFLWHWRRTRLRRHNRRSDESPTKPARKLTLRDGKAIPRSEALDTASTREPYSLDLESSDIEKQFKVDMEKDIPKQHARKASKRASRRSLRSTQKERPTWTPGRPPWLQKTPEVSKQHSKEPQQKLEPTGRPKPRERRRSIPRPSLITIERRGSSQTRRSRLSSEPVPSLSSHMRQSEESKPSPARQRRGSDSTLELQRKRRGMGISESLYNAYRGPGPWGGETHQLPPSPALLPSPAESEAGSAKKSGYRWSVPASASVQASIPDTAGFASSSRAVSQPDALQPPPPLFSAVNYRPHVSFAQTNDLNRQSFLSMTDSPASSTSSERAFPGPKVVYPTIKEPQTASTSISTAASKPPVYNEQSRPVRAPSFPTPNAVEVVERVRAFGRQYREEQPSTEQRRGRDLSTAGPRPPSIEVEIPHTESGSMSFFDATPTAGNIVRGKELIRGPSVMSDRSGMTIASSEISSNWTIGKAELVNIYPSVGDEQSTPGIEGSESMSVAPSPSDRATPPYAKMLRSKYGQYPRGRRDKALPTLPKSPLSQFPPGF
ncbi:MAG: hypothetical protein Q9163_004922 [Psora crenata]